MPHLVPILALLLQVQATNAELGYRFTLPDGFTPFPEAQTQKDVLGCWSEETPTSTHGGMVLCVSRLHGVLPREAVQIVFAGPADQEARGNTLMASTLGALEGRRIG